MFDLLRLQFPILQRVNFIGISRENGGLTCSVALKANNIRANIIRGHCVGPNTSCQIYAVDLLVLDPTRMSESRATNLGARGGIGTREWGTRRAKIEQGKQAYAGTEGCSDANNSPFPFV